MLFNCLNFKPIQAFHPLSFLLLKLFYFFCCLFRSIFSLISSSLFHQFNYLLVFLLFLYLSWLVPFLQKHDALHFAILDFLNTLMKRSFRLLWIEKKRMLICNFKRGTSSVLIWLLLLQFRLPTLLLCFMLLV